MKLWPLNWLFTLSEAKREVLDFCFLDQLAAETGRLKTKQRHRWHSQVNNNETEIDLIISGNSKRDAHRPQKQSKHILKPPRKRQTKTRVSNNAEAFDSSNWQWKGAVAIVSISSCVCEVHKNSTSQAGQVLQVKNIRNNSGISGVAVVIQGKCVGWWEVRFAVCWSWNIAILEVRCKMRHQVAQSGKNGGNAVDRESTK